MKHSKDASVKTLCIVIYNAKLSKICMLKTYHKICFVARKPF